jgi:hypothetical protein
VYQLFIFTDKLLHITYALSSKERNDWAYGPMPDNSQIMKEPVSTHNHDSQQVERTYPEPPVLCWLFHKPHWFIEFIPPPHPIFSYYYYYYFKIKYFLN